MVIGLVFFIECLCLAEGLAHGQHDNSSMNEYGMKK